VSYISQKDHEDISKRSAVDDGDIIFAMIGTIGNPVIVNKDREFSIKNVALIKFYDDSQVVNTYVKLLLESDYAEERLYNLKRGGTQKFVSLTNIREFEIPIPPMRVQKDITKKYKKYLEVIEQNKKLVTDMERKIQDKIKVLFE
jgi:restriction endonuclease S subunit